jgi:Iap family predicted aminopeptidase
MKVSRVNLQKTTNELCKFENRIAGTKMEHEAAKYLVSRLKDMGFDNVAQHEFPVITWEPLNASLEIIEPTNKSMSCALMPYSINYDERVRLIDMDSNQGKKKDKFPVFGLADWGTVLFERPTVFYHMALEMGLDGVIISSPKEGNMLKVLIVNRGSELQLPVFSISHEDGMMLRELMKDSEVILEVKAKVKKGQSTSSNIEVIIEGSESDYDIVVGAHYDAWFQGAADNAVPVAVVLEVARVLIEQTAKLKRSVRFVLFGAEESGTDEFYYWVNGSKHYVDSQQTLENIGLMINVECIGYEAPNYIVSTHDTSSFANAIIRDLKQEKRFVHWAPPGYGSDHWFFTNNGVPTIELISWPSDLYHTQLDIPDAIDYESVKAYTKYVIRAVRNFSEFNELPFDFMNQADQIRKGLEEISTPKDGSLDFQPLLYVLSVILGLKSEYEQYLEKKRSKEESLRFNEVIRRIVGSMNKTIGILPPVNGWSEAKHLPLFDLVQDVLRLDSVINSLGKMPLMNISPGTRTQFRNYEEIPISWTDVETPMKALVEEREKLVKKLDGEISDCCNLFSTILEEIKSLVR